jgi:energy-coupling factor transporter ATP-binding protein EcfA2
VSDVSPLPPLSREEQLALPSVRRLPYIEQIRVVYPRWNTILGRIDDCYQLQPYAAEPPCLLLVGPSGAGKSTLVASYAQQYPRIYTPRGVIQPVLRATLPSKATEMNLLTELLDAIGDPRAANGTIGGKTLRLKSYIRDCKVRMFMLDELQHFRDQESAIILANVTNWLKTLIKETRVACVLVGLKGEAEEVVNTNPQLARLFGDPLVLAPFVWDNEQPATITEFRTFLSQLEALLPLREASNLAVRECAWRCFVACDGITAFMMSLVRRATQSALISGRECLDDVLLAQAFDRHLAGERRGIPNPFIGDPPLPNQPKPTPSASPSTNQRATGNKGKTRKPRKPTARDAMRS